MSTLDALTRYEGDLFDMLPEVAQARQQTKTKPFIDGLTVLRDSIPEALECVIHLHYFRKGPDSHGLSLSSNGWGYNVRKAGIRYSYPGEFPGFEHNGPHLITWEQLTKLVGSHPHRQELIEYEQSLDAPKWKDLYRPYELWPNPQRWHPDYFRMDRERPLYADRMHAWHTLQDLLTETIKEITR